MAYENIQVNTQSSIRVAGAKVVYFDPFQISKETHDADIIVDSEPGRGTCITVSF